MIDLIGKATSNRGNSPAASPTALQRAPRQIVEVGNEGSISKVSQIIRKDIDEVIVQGIVAGVGGVIENNSQQAHIYVDVPTFYFDLVLYEVNFDEETGDETFDRMVSPFLLQPDKAYIVRVSNDLNPYVEAETSSSTWKMEQNLVRVKGRLSLTLEENLRGTTSAAIECPEGSGQFDPTQQDGWFYDFRIITRESFSKERLFLELWYTGVGAPRWATTLEVSLQQTENSVVKASDEILPCYLPVRAEPPEKTAVLHILPDGQNQLKFVGWVRDLKDRPSNLNPITFPQIVSEDYEKEVDYLNAIWEKFSDFASTDPGNIAQWFEAVLSLYKNDCCFIIVDQTEAQLPWEMFSLKDGRCLGATAAIVRWTNEEYYGQAMMLQLNNVEYTGHIAAYVHSPETSLPVLNDLVSQYCSAPSELQYQLAATEGNSSVAILRTVLGGDSAVIAKG